MQEPISGLRRSEGRNRELAVSLARARQEVRAAALLSRGGHAAESLRLSLRALDSALVAGQLKTGRNEPAAALSALGLAPTAADVLRRARILDVPALDVDVADDVRELAREARKVTRELLRLALGLVERRSWRERFTRFVARLLRPLSLAR
jgi:hypothetical protein